jgi:hypothetical protein
MDMRADLRALLQRLAQGERRFDNPTEEFVDNLYTLQSYGWVKNVLAKRSVMEAAHPYYLAAALITEEGRLALQEGDT